MKKVLVSLFFLFNFMLNFADDNKEILPDAISKTRGNWINSFNISRDNISLYYYKDSFLVMTDEQSNVYLNNKNIEQYYMSILKENKIKKYEAIYAVKYDSIKYIEISKFEIDNGENLFSIAEWELKKNKWSINFEIITKSSRESPVVEIDKLKILSDYWLKIANSGNVKFLCEEMYGENGYYIDWEINKGKEAVYAKFKEFMETPEYFINFKETVYFSINENTGVEIGKYEMPFGTGNFMLVWKKDSFGKWHVIIDKG